MGSIEDSIQKLKDLERSWPDLPWNEQSSKAADAGDHKNAGLGQPAQDGPMPVPSRPPITAGPHLGTTAADAELLTGGLFDQARTDRLSRAEHGTPDDAAAGEDHPGAIEVQLDLRMLEAKGFLVRPRTRTPLAEEFRHIKRPLIENARSKNAQAERLSLVMVTSALPGEGKTFLAINLALSMAAEIDLEVLLIEADVIRPDLLNRLGIDSRPGLLDLLADPELHLDDVVIKTNVPKLSILSAGRPNSMATELLASEAMEDLLVSLARRQKDTIVIFDCPPLLVTNEAKVLAARLGQVLLVVEASRTTRASVALAFAALEQCPIVMSVLNRASEPGELYGYGYGYYQR
jgi:protein-tyrosine kinase